MDGNGDKKIFIDEAAKLSGWSEDTLRKWCQRGRIVCEKLGIKWIVVLDINNNIKPLEIKPKGREAVNG